MSDTPIIVWFRRDLRLGDHPALDAAIATGAPVVPAYVLDDETPGEWRLGAASRWWLARQSALACRRSAEPGLAAHSAARRERARAAAAGARDRAGAVYFTRGYERFMPPLEARLQAELKDTGVGCRRFGGHLFLEPEAVRTRSGEPFKAFTPFYKECLTREPPASPLAAPKHLPAPDAWPASERLENWGLRPSPIGRRRCAGSGHRARRARQRGCGTSSARRWRIMPQTVTVPTSTALRALSPHLSLRRDQPAPDLARGQPRRRRP